MALSTLEKALIAVVAVFVVLLVLALVVLGVWWFFIRNNKLPTPEGEMTLLRGPYVSENAAAAVYTSPAEEVTRLNRALYAKFGYRAVIKDSSDAIISDRTSDIKYNDRIYQVNIVGSEDGGLFTFKIPKQSVELIDSDIYYLLIGSFYDNEDASGTPIYKELFLGEIVSTATTLELTESSAAKNKSIQP